MATTQKTNSGTLRRPTIATIASHMGLSKATVTHVLNGRANEQRIRPETKNRVLEVAQDLGYRANASARAIRAGRFGNIALVQSLLGQYLPRELLLGLMKAIANKDLHLVLSQVSDGVIDNDSYLPHTMRELSADGVLVYRHVGFSQPFLEQIHKSRIPAIFLNVQQDSDCIHPDDLMGGRLATEFLLRLGHERIAYVDTEVYKNEFYSNQHYSKHDRRSGYEQVMMATGRAPWVYLLPQEWEGNGRIGVDQRVESAKSLLSGDGRPTAVVAYELTEAMAVVHAAHLLGLRIPEDLSIILFHNRIDDRYFIPFHTVSNVMEKMGEEAVGMLIEKIEYPEIELPTKAVPMEMLEGATCMPPHN
ncbi:MAG: LacI family DNA-binding transcriptional regulator [Fibrella sp.]|nr:LacI family DNA-binding transcriptional regulator [Armatimonadota bacterium]